MLDLWASPSGADWATKPLTSGKTLWEIATRRSNEPFAGKHAEGIATPMVNDHPTIPPPPQELVLQLASNGDTVKLSRLRNRQWTKPLQLNAETLRKRSSRVRTALGAMSEYFRENPNSTEERDLGWRRYSDGLRELQEAGQGLYDALFDENEAAKTLAAAIDAIKPRGELTVQVADDDVTIPFGFVHDGDVSAPRESPRRAHFHGFWLSQLRITVLVQNGGSDPDSLRVDPESFRALYALNRTEFANAAESLDALERQRLKSLLEIPLREHFDWASAKRAWDEQTGNIVFVLAHSDGDLLSLAESKLDSGSFSKRFSRREDGPATLLILNCCLSATGARGRSLLSAVARPGFTGLVGTEARILNSYALRCGTQLMWDICAHGRTLGEALDALQQREEPGLFPLNLFYTCCADRAFSLRSPLSMLSMLKTDQA